MKINPGPKGLLPWSDAEQEEGRKLAASLSPAEVYLLLTAARCRRYEVALSEVETYCTTLALRDLKETAQFALHPELQPQT